MHPEGTPLVTGSMFIVPFEFELCLISPRRGSVDKVWSLFHPVVKQCTSGLHLIILVNSNIGTSKYTHRNKKDGDSQVLHLQQAVKETSIDFSHHLSDIIPTAFCARVWSVHFTGLVNVSALLSAFFLYIASTIFWILHNNPVQHISLSTKSSYL